VVELIELMNLQSYRDKFVSELSTGVRGIVDLTMAIAHNPTVLLLDEPSSGVAQRETEALGPLLKDMQRATQCSIVIIEHDMPLISAVSDEIIALDLGRVVARGSPSAVLSDPRVVASYLGDNVGVIQRSGSVPAVQAQRAGSHSGQPTAVDQVIPHG
jgi:branched-chain amino acid transport system ATP-binding protein